MAVYDWLHGKMDGLFVRLRGLSVQLHECLMECMNSYKDGCGMYRYVDGWMVRQVDYWIAIWMDRLMNE